MATLIHDPAVREILSEETVYRLRVSGELGQVGKAFRIIDLYAGAGGLTTGFTSRSGHLFEPVWANDFNGESVGTYNLNFGAHCVHGDIVDILADSRAVIPKADVVIGGPPCQGFSLLNRNREGDPRKQLWRPFLEVVRRSEAQVFVMENVPQLLGAPEYVEMEGGDRW